MLVIRGAEQRQRGIKKKMRDEIFPEKKQRKYGRGNARGG
jgi:hypothetical protein